MSWRERIDHIFTYYKPAMVGILAFLVVISLGVNAIQQKLNPPLYSGVLIGLSTNETTRSYLTEELKDYFAAPQSKRAVVLKEIPIANKEDPQSSIDNQNAYTQLAALVSGKDLEYALMDEDAWALLKAGYFFADLREFLSPEQIQQFSSQMQWVEDRDTGASVPLGLEVSSLPGIQRIVSENTRVYLAFPANTENIPLNAEFLKYLSQ